MYRHIFNLLHSKVSYKIKYKVVYRKRFHSVFFKTTYICFNLLFFLYRSPSCPQCREKVTLNKIHRIYFNFFNNDSVTEDVCSLHDKIDKLNFELLLRDKNSKSYFEKSETLQIQNTGLKHEVRKVEKELNEKNSTIYALKEQVKYHKQQNAETESLKQEIERLQNKIKIYKKYVIISKFWRI